MLARLWSRTYATGLLPLAAVAVAFIALVLASSPLRMSFGWDEAVYASQISQHHPIMQWGAERARGMPLLAAPVTLFTSSAVALRIYLAIASGVGLFLALSAWRGLRPPRVLALAAVLFGGLWTTQLYAPLVFPNLWTAFGAVASLGLFLRALRKVSWFTLILLSVAVAFIGLMRPVDAAVLCAPLVIVGLIKSWHQTWPAIAAVGCGLAVALGDWLIETFIYFHGLGPRLRQASVAGGGTKFSLSNSLRIISGGNDSSVPVPGVHNTGGWNYAWLLLWWAAFIAFAILGVYLARRSQGVAIACLPLACALAIYLLYAFPVRDNVRYLLPAWALLSVPASDGITWLAGETHAWRRSVAITCITAFLGVELIYGHFILIRQAHGLEATAATNVRIAKLLVEEGVRPPCVVTSPMHSGIAVSEPVAYAAGCSYRWGLKHLYQAKHQQVVIIMKGNGLPWQYAVAWRPHRLWGLKGLVSYVQPPPSRHDPPRRHQHRKRR
jgi:hypothetical protein